MTTALPPSEQLVEWVDETGSVLGIVTRARMRAENLRHRAVYVVVRTVEDRIVVHRRADWKDVWGGFWDLAFGGVMNVGEPWAAGARRELAEEAGIETVDVYDLGTFSYEDTAVSLLGRAFLVTTDAATRPHDGEVVEIGHVPRAGLRAWAAARPVCPDSLVCVLPLVAAWQPST